MFANSKVTLYNWVVIGLMAMTFIVAFKIASAKFPIAGVNEIAQMA